MSKGVRRAPIAALVAILALATAIAACGDDEDSTTGSSDAPAGLTPRDDIQIEFANIGEPGTPFYNVLENGAIQAGEDLGVDVEYKATDAPDAQEQARLIEAAVARQPDGLIVTDNFPDVLDPKISEAVDAGIPTIVINDHGEDTLEQTGAMAFVGQDEFDVGKQAGELLADAGVTKVLCINHSPGAVFAENRCGGLASAYPKGDVKEIPIDGEDRTAARNGIQAAIESNPDFDGILALGDIGAEPALDAIAASGRDITLGTIDLSPKVLEAVANGDILFASDQQQYLQGYIPVQQLVMFLQYGLRPPEFTPTGPNQVTEENAEDAIELTEQGIR
jgi:simple sugar transport system substrate-binding protein